MEALAKCLTHGLQHPGFNYLPPSCHVCTSEKDSVQSRALASIQAALSTRHTSLLCHCTQSLYPTPLHASSLLSLPGCEKSVPLESTHGASPPIDSINREWTDVG